MTRIATLSEIGIVKTGKTPSKNNPEFWGDKVGFITPSDFTSSKYVYASRRISQAGVNALRNVIVPRRSVLVTYIGSDMGKVARVEEESVITNQQINTLIVNTSIADADFIYYLLKAKYKLLRNLGVDSGSTMPIINKTTFEKIKIELPNLETQKKIANILGSLDEKIELNRRMNETLEQLGQTLFRHYFVDNLEARSWDKKPLDEIANFLNGLAMQKYPKINKQPTLPVIKIREMSSGITDSTDIASANISKEYIIHDDDLLFSWSGTLMVRFRSGGDGALNQHLFKVISDKYPEWLYCYWTKYHLDQFISIAKSKATTMGHIQRKHLKQAEVIMPPNIKEMTLELAPIIDQIKTNLFEINSLVNIRDALLPKLISGEIEI